MNYISLEQTKMGFRLRKADSRGDKFVTRGIILGTEVMTSTGGISTDGGVSRSRVVMVIQNVGEVRKLPMIRKIMRVQKMTQVQKPGQVLADKGAGVFTGGPERRGLAAEPGLGRP